MNILITHNKITLLFVLLLISTLQAQQPIYFFNTVESGKIKPIGLPSSQYTEADVITWNKNQATEIPLQTNFEYSTLPTDPWFSESSMLQQYNSARQKWENASRFRFENSRLPVLESRRARMDGSFPET